MLFVGDNHLHIYFEPQDQIFRHFICIRDGVRFTSFKGSCVASLSKTHIRYSCIINSAAGFVDERSGKVNISHVSSYSIWCLMCRELNLLISGHHFESFSKTIYLLYFSQNGSRRHSSFPGYLTPFDHLFSVISVVHMSSRATETHFMRDDRIRRKLCRLQYWAESSDLVQFNVKLGNMG